MLDEVRKHEPPEGDFVEFLRAGSPAAGEFRCSSCGYGVTVQAALPQCPMCAGTTWESAAWSPPVRRRRLQ
jgi:rubredoxin